MSALVRPRSVVLVAIAVVVVLLVALGVGDPSDVGLAGAVGAAPKTRGRAPHVGARLARLARGHSIAAVGSSRFSTTYRLADGSMVTRVSSAPVNFPDRSGRWQAIDDTLVARGGTFGPRADGHGLALPRRLGSGVGVSSGRDRVSMRLLGADGTASVHGARAEYRNVLPSTAVLYDSEPGGLREQLVLSDSRAPKRFAFALTATRGLRARATGGGAVIFSRAGRRVFVMPPSIAYPQGEESDVHPVRSTLQRTPQGWTLTLRPNGTWLTRALQHGPVVVDPTLEIDPDSQDCFIESDTPTTNYCSSPHLSVGYDGTNDQRGLVQFDLSALPKDAVVLNADFGLTLGGHSTNNAKQVGVYRVLQPWTNDATWNKYDATHSWGTAGAAGSGDASTSAAATVTTGTGSGFVDWYPTRLVQDWVSGTLPNYGLLVRDVTPNTTANELDFSSREGGSVTPELDIVWAPRTGQLKSYTFDSQRLTDRSSLGVNVANGNLLLASNDLHVAGTGLDLDLTRYHNSMGTDFGDQGMGIPGTMSLGRDVHLTAFADGSVAYYRGDGVVLPFLDRTVSGSTASFSAPNDLNATLTQDTSTSVYTLTFNRTGVVQTFNSSGQLTSVKDQNANTISLSYYSSGGQGLSGITDTQGRSYTVTQVSGDGYVDTITDPTSRTWSYTYGHFDTDYLTTYEDPAGHDTVYDYDSSHRLTQITTPAGNVTKITYDGTSQRVASVIRTTDAGHTTGPTTSYAYSSGSPCTTGQEKTVVTDPDSHATTYCSDAGNDRVASVTDAAGNKRATTYTPNGDTSGVTDTPGGTGTAGVQSLSYDTNNNLTSTDGAEGEHTSTSYYTSSDTDGGGGALAVFRPKQSTDDQGTSQYFKYDNHGNLTSVADAASSPRSKSILAYNNPGNGVLTSATDGNGNTTSFGHDAAGNLTSITPPTPLAATTITDDSLSRLHTVQTGTGGVTKTVTYDALDRPTRVDLSDGSYFTYSYDDDGNLTQRTDSAGNTTSYTVDPLGRRTHEGFPSSRSNDYTYDAAGNLKTIVDAAGTVTYNYDAINRVTSIVSPTASGGSTDTVSYSYDDPNRTETMTLPGSTTEKYSFDKSGDTTNITIKNSGGTVLRSLAYDYSYLVGSTTKHGGLIQSVTDQAGQRTIYTYRDTTVPEDVGRLVKAHVQTSGGSLVDEWRYNYDAAGNRTKLAHDVPAGGGGVTTTTTTMAYNAANELCWKYTGTSSNTCSSAPTGATSYSFDNRGNQTAAGSTSYGYDNYDRATGLAGTTAAYLTPDNTELVAYGTTSYQNNLLGLSRDIGSSSTTNYVRNPSGLPSSQRTSSSKQFFLNDALGSTVALTDTTGSIVRSYTYDPDGNATTTGSGATTNLQYAAGTQLGSLLHFGARHYDGTTARWTQLDPIVDYADLIEANGYTYAGSDPINASDVGGTRPARDPCEYRPYTHVSRRNYCTGYPYTNQNPRQFFSTVITLYHVAQCAFRLAETRGDDPSKCNSF